MLRKDIINRANYKKIDCFSTNIQLHIVASLKDCQIVMIYSLTLACRRLLALACVASNLSRTFLPAFLFFRRRGFSSCCHDGSHFSKMQSPLLSSIFKIFANIDVRSINFNIAITGFSSCLMVLISQECNQQSLQLLLYLQTTKSLQA